jgi:hypothetical protein
MFDATPVKEKLNNQNVMSVTRTARMTPVASLRNI